MPLEAKNYDPALMAGANLGVKVDLTDITDQNDNEVIEIDGVTSAVNYIAAVNAAASTSSELAARGDDTNVNMLLTPKGTGVILLGTSGSSTIASGAVTINATRGVIQSGVSIAVGSTALYSFDFVNNRIWPTKQLLLTLGGAAVTSGFPFLGQTTLGSGSATVRIGNANGFVAIAGSVTVQFLVI